MVASQILKYFGLLCLGVLWMSPKVYEVYSPYFLGEKKEGLLPAIMLIYGGLLLLEYKFLSYWGKKRFSWLVRFPFTLCYSGISTLGIRMVITGWEKWDVVLEKPWLKVVRKYTMEEKWMVGQRWCREFSNDLTKGQYMLEDEAIKNAALSCETMSQLRQRLMEETIELYVEGRVSEVSLLVKSMSPLYGLLCSTVVLLAVLFLEGRRGE